MKILIAGGTGFLGGVLAKSFLVDKHPVYILTRNPKVSFPGAQVIPWDGKTTTGWGNLVNEMDAVIHVAGKSLASWPWTAGKKRSFLESRVQPGLALASAIQKATRRPRVFIQQSGINYYGLQGIIADESTPPAGDFLAQLVVQCENVTKPLVGLGVRWIATRSAVVLAREALLFRLMALPVKLFLGGPIGGGKQAMPWIHIKDWIAAVRFLIDQDDASGGYNLISPVPTSNAEFTRTLAKVIHRPYWFPTPAFLLRILLGEMSILVVEGRFSQPKRLIESGYRFQFPSPSDAFHDLYGKI